MAAKGGKSLLAQRAIEPLDRQGIFLPQRNQAAHAASMPSKVADLAASLTVIGLGQTALANLDTLAM